VALTSEGNDSGAAAPNSLCLVVDSSREAFQGHPGVKKAATVLGFGVFSHRRGRQSRGVCGSFDPKDREEQQGLAHSGGKGEGRRRGGGPAGNLAGSHTEWERGGGSRTAGRGGEAAGAAMVCDRWSRGGKWWHVG
jgi:hypothetical protein